MVVTKEAVRQEIDGQVVVSSRTKLSFQGFEVVNKKGAVIDSEKLLPLLPSFLTDIDLSEEFIAN